MLTPLSRRSRGSVQFVGRCATVRSLSRQRTTFGTWGSQVQILPLRPAFSQFPSRRGLIWGTKPDFFPYAPHEPSDSRFPRRTRRRPRLTDGHRVRRVTRFPSTRLRIWGSGVRIPPSAPIISTTYLIFSSGARNENRLRVTAGVTFDNILADIALLVR
jgi:hypothetical protein